MRAGMYARLSLVKAGKADTSTVRQLEDAGHIAARLGADIRYRWSDSGRSGWSGAERDDFRQMLTVVRERNIDVLIAWKFDRLTRNLPDYAELWTALCDNKVRLVTGDGIDTTHQAGWLQADIAFAVARAESQNISFRTIAAKRTFARQGRPAGGPRPFGYRQEDGQLLIDEAEAALIREAAHRVIAGDGLSRIVRDWNSRGLTSTRGGRWAHTSLRDTLLAPRIVGQREHNGKLFDAAWEPILDRRTWERIRSILTDPRRRTSPKIPRSHPLTGLLECGRCGHRLYAKAYPDKTRAYQCLRHYGGCGRLGVKAEDLEELIRGLVITALTQPDTRQGLIDAEASDDDRAELIALLDADREALRDLVKRMYVTRDLPTDAFEDARIALEARIAEAEREIRQQSMGRSVIDLPSDRKELEDILNGPAGRQRMLLAGVLSAVIVNPAKPGANRFDSRRVVPRWRHAPA